MDERENKSEVARLMRLEYEAAQRGMYGFAMGAAKHQFITAKMENNGFPWRICNTSITIAGESVSRPCLRLLRTNPGEFIPDTAGGRP